MRAMRFKIHVLALAISIILITLVIYPFALRQYRRWLPDIIFNYIDLLKVDEETRAFMEKETREKPYRAPSYPSEIGDCINNGDSDMKNLNPNCGCDPEPEGTITVHPCCRPHLLNMVRDVFHGAVELQIPLIVDGGSIIGWHRNKTLIPYDQDLDANLPNVLFHMPKFIQFLDQLAAKGYCVWFREEQWIKIWSSVIGMDIWGYKVVNGGEMIFREGAFAKYFDISLFHPRRTEVIEGTTVFIPHNPKAYMDRYYGEGGWQKPLRCSKIEDRKCIS